MDFRILGRLEVQDGANLVAVGGRLHPKILAGLLLNVGRTVSLSWLVDLLWDDEPPASARRQAQNAVAALRRQLAPVRARLIERTGQHYRLNIADEELDLRRFEHATLRARRHAEAGAAARALAEYDRALALWRGPALTGLPGRTFAAAAARLDDLRLSAHEERAEVALRLGESERVVADLREPVAENPLRQRLTAHLMHALYRTGRASEAGRLFDSIRDRLAEDLGVDPGDELRRLHVRILQEDPDLLSTTAAASMTPTPPVPAQLPADVSTFTGRADQLAALDRLRDTGARAGVVTTIAGIGGVGKTALAVRWGHARRDWFPDGQLYLNLRGFDEREPLTAHEAVSRLLRSLGHASNEIPTDVDEAVRLYRGLLADKRMLVVLDNARTFDHVGSLLPKSPGCLALITSRNSLPGTAVGHGTHHVHLDALSFDESLDLLTHLLGADATADVDITRELARLCGHLPLALRIAAANLVRSPDITMSEFATELATGSRLSKLSIDEDRESNLAAVFELSYRALDDDAQLLFLRLGLIPGEDFTASLAAAITDLTIEDVQIALEQLETAHLLQQHLPGRYRLHDLVRLFARETASTELTKAQHDGVSDRLVDWYGDRSNPYMPEFDNILALGEVLSDHPRLWKVVGTLGLIANAGVASLKTRPLAESALRAAAANEDVEGQIHVYDALGGFALAAGDHKNAIEYRLTAARLLPQLDDSALEAKINNGLGIALNGRGSLPEAAHHQRRAVEIAEANDLKEQLFISLANLGGVYRTMGRYSEALTCTSRAERISRDSGTLFGRVATLINLGLIHKDLGEYSKALAAVRRSFEVAEDFGASKPLVMALQVLGMISHEAGDFHDAAEYYERAAAICRRNPNLVLQIGNLHYQADLHLTLGAVKRAFRCLDAARRLAVYRRLSSTEQAFELLLLGRAHLASGETDSAIEHIQRATALYRTEHFNPLQLGRSLAALGDAHGDRGDHDEAVACWTEAFEIFTELGVPEAPKLEDTLLAHASSAPAVARRDTTDQNK